MTINSIVSNAIALSTNGFIMLRYDAWAFDRNAISNELTARGYKVTSNNGGLRHHATIIAVRAN